MTDFDAAVGSITYSIQSFHKRFDCEYGNRWDRWALLNEEFKEYTNEVRNNDETLALHEVADVAFVALGTLHLAGQDGVDALNAVANKNNAKTWVTHYRHPQTGKITRKPAQKCETFGCNNTAQDGAVQIAPATNVRVCAECAATL